MIPSVFALIVLAAGLILIHFGIKDLTTQLGKVTLVLTPFIIQPGKPQ